MSAEETAERHAEFMGWRSLLGKRVRVTLEYGKLDRSPAVVAEGVLVAFDEGGEARLVDEMGFLHYCWPMLKVEPVEKDEIDG